MKTTYAYGRTKLPTPTITTSGGGTIQGANQTYYFWLKARNRVGFNDASDPLTLTIPNNAKLNISAATFSTFNYEDWREMVVFFNTTNNFLTSRAIYKQKMFASNQVTLTTVTNIVLDNNFIINGNVNIATTASLPTNVPTGFRIRLTSNNKIYEYDADSTATANDITVLGASVGRWLYVPSESLTEPNSFATKELYTVTESDLVYAPLPSLLQTPVPVEYYIINDESAPLTAGELILNAYLSDTSIKCEYHVQLIGYLNLTTNILDTTGINQINTTVIYPTTKLQLSKALPSNSAFVFSITPNFLYTSEILKGTELSFYPKLVNYTTISDVSFWADSVADIASLRAIPLSVVKDRQTRYVASQKAPYSFNNTSTLADNGSTVITPNSNPTQGRWLAAEATILPQSITSDKLAPSVLNLFTAKIGTDTVTLTLSTAYVINLDSVTTDYFILKTPPSDGQTTTINVTATLANNETRAILLELRQNTGAVSFDSSLLFPGGTIPLLSGNGKTDLFAITLTKDGSGVTKKRICMVQKDIG